MATERDLMDGVTLDECDLMYDGVKLMTCQDINVSVKQDKKFVRGPGNKKKPVGRIRGPKNYEFSMSCTGVNKALMVPPEDHPVNKGGLTSFFVKGEEYTCLMDLRNSTLTLLYPYDDGTRREIRLKGAEFNELSAKLSLGDAENQSLSGDATSCKGLF